MHKTLARIIVFFLVPALLAESVSALTGYTHFNLSKAPSDYFGYEALSPSLNNSLEPLNHDTSWRYRAMVRRAPQSRITTVPIKLSIWIPYHKGANVKDLSLPATLDALSGTRIPEPILTAARTILADPRFAGLPLKVAFVKEMKAVLILAKQQVMAPPYAEIHGIILRHLPGHMFEIAHVTSPGLALTYIPEGFQSGPGEFQNRVSEFLRLYDQGDEGKARADWMKAYRRKLEVARAALAKRAALKRPTAPNVAERMLIPGRNERSRYQGWRDYDPFHPDPQPKPKPLLYQDVAFVLAAIVRPTVVDELERITRAEFKRDAGSRARHPMSFGSIVVDSQGKSEVVPAAITAKFKILEQTAVVRWTMSDRDAPSGGTLVGLLPKPGQLLETYQPPAILHLHSDGTAQLFFLKKNVTELPHVWKAAVDAKMNGSLPWELEAKDLFEPVPLGPYWTPPPVSTPREFPKVHKVFSAEELRRLDYSDDGKHISEALNQFLLLLTEKFPFVNLGAFCTILVNALENAAKHRPSHGTAQMDLLFTGSEILLVLSNLSETALPEFLRNRTFYSYSKPLTVPKEERDHGRRGRWRPSDGLGIPAMVRSLNHIYTVIPGDDFVPRMHFSEKQESDYSRVLFELHVPVRHKPVPNGSPLGVFNLLAQEDRWYKESEIYRELKRAPATLAPDFRALAKELAIVEVRFDGREHEYRLPASTFVNIAAIRGILEDLQASARVHHRPSLSELERARHEKIQPVLDETRRIGREEMAKERQVILRGFGMLQQLAGSLQEIRKMDRFELGRRLGAKAVSGTYAVLESCPIVVVGHQLWQGILDVRRGRLDKGKVREFDDIVEFADGPGIYYSREGILDRDALALTLGNSNAGRVSRSGFFHELMELLVEEAGMGLAGFANAVRDMHPVVQEAEYRLAALLGRKEMAVSQSNFYLKFYALLQRVEAEKDPDILEMLRLSLKFMAHNFEGFRQHGYRRESLRLWEEAGRLATERRSA